MGTQVCFTADDNLVSAIDEIAKKIERSRSDTISTVLWLAIQNIRTKQPRDFGELVQSVSAGTGFTAPATFQVEREFSISNQDRVDTENLKETFKKKLQEGWDLGARINIMKVNVNGQPRLFYNIKKLDQKITSQATVLEFISVSQDLQAVRLKVSCSRDPTGMVADMTGEEKPLSPEELGQYGLNSDRMITMVQGFIAGDLY
jgi:hypothetical protein